MATELNQLYPHYAKYTNLSPVDFCLVKIKLLYQTFAFLLPFVADFI